MFIDADITKNLCICKLSCKNVDKYNWNSLQFVSFNQNFIEFYKKNNSLPMRYVFQRCDNALVSDFNFEKDFIEVNRIPCERNGYCSGGNGLGYRWNILREKNIFRSGLTVVHFESDKARSNFSTWVYSGMKNLADQLIWGLNMQTVSDTCSIAIPQIDWETISDHPLWVQGKYDEAVLDTMGLKLSEDRSEILEK